MTEISGVPAYNPLLQKGSLRHSRDLRPGVHKHIEPDPLAICERVCPLKSIYKLVLFFFSYRSTASRSTSTKLTSIAAAIFRNLWRNAFGTLNPRFT